MPCCIKPFAASRPNKPPPITTACLCSLAAAIMVSTSLMSRKAITPSRSLPGTGIMKGSEPEAINKRSYDSSVPSSVMTLRLTRSIEVTSLPLCKVTLLSLYHCISLSIISSMVLSPASTGESIMRL